MQYYRPRCSIIFNKDSIKRFNLMTVIQHPLESVSLRRRYRRKTRAPYHAPQPRSRASARLRFCWRTFWRKISAKRRWKRLKRASTIRAFQVARRSGKVGRRSAKVDRRSAKVRRAQKWKKSLKKTNFEKVEPRPGNVWNGRPLLNRKKMIKKCRHPAATLDLINSILGRIHWMIRRRRRGWRKERWVTPICPPPIWPISLHRRKTYANYPKTIRPRRNVNCE